MKEAVFLNIYYRKLSTSPKFIYIFLENKMSGSIEHTAANTTTSDEIADFTNLKRPADENVEQNREAKAIKLEVAEQEKPNNETEAESSETALAEDMLTEVDKGTPAVQSEATPEVTITSTSNDTATPLMNTDTNPNESAVQAQSSHPHHHNTALLTMAQNAPPPPPGLQLLTDPQQQQLLQNYVQAQGQDLASLTASSLAQAMVSPIAVPSLASNLLQQLQQGGNVITALPGPPQLSHPSSGSGLHPTPPNSSPLSDDGNNNNKRSSARSLSNDERRQRRLLRNRVAAKECRKKKKLHIQEMEEKIVQLEKENENLVKEVEELKSKLALGSMEGSESYRLMKEVKELNAKLGMGGPLPTNSSALNAAVMAATHQPTTTPITQQQSMISNNSTVPTVVVQDNNDNEDGTKAISLEKQDNPAVTTLTNENTGNTLIYTNDGVIF
jgi:hypothetical protein